VTGYDVLGSPDDSVMAELVRSSDYGDGPFQSGCTITDDTHFITNGPYGSFSGSCTAEHNDHDHYVPDGTAGCVEVIAVDSTYSKVIDCVVGAGHITGWNGNRGCADWSPVDWQNMLRNWISEALANTSNIEETTWGQIKAL
ncbi:hypothetical protein K8R78_03110, partial [bacterium]|nr:hypothetical protein [bacterium]